MSPEAAGKWGYLYSCTCSLIVLFKTKSTPGDLRWIFGLFSENFVLSFGALTCEVIESLSLSLVSASVTQPSH